MPRVFLGIAAIALCRVVPGRAIPARSAAGRASLAGMRTLLPIATAITLAAAAPSCGPGVDHTPTLHRLRDAIEAPIRDPSQLEDHNQLVEDVVRQGALEGLRQHEVQARIGRGAQCGVRPLCAEHGFRASDWVYDVGRDPTNPDLPAGPTLIVGFDAQGFVNGTYYSVRR